MHCNDDENTNLEHEVEGPGHDDGVVEGNHGGDGEEAVPCTESLFGQLSCAGDVKGNSKRLYPSPPRPGTRRGKI